MLHSTCIWICELCMIEACATPMYSVAGYFIAHACNKIKYNEIGCSIIAGLFYFILLPGYNILFYMCGLLNQIKSNQIQIYIAPCVENES